MAQWLSTMAALAEDPGLGPSTCMEVDNHLINSSSKGSNALLWSLWAPGTHVVHTHMYMK